VHKNYNARKYEQGDNGRLDHGSVHAISLRLTIKHRPYAKHNLARICPKSIRHISP